MSMVINELDQLANQPGWFHPLSGKQPQRPNHIHEGLDLAFHSGVQVRNQRVMDALDNG